MIQNDQFDRISQVLPFLKKADPAVRSEFMQHSNLARIPAGSDVFLEGDRIDAIALIISGVVRVYKISETGREITLYRFGLGESCILSANAILSRQTFPAVATVEKEAEAILIPAEAFRRWVGRYELWRELVFDLLSNRLASVMALVDEVAFRRMDVRVAGLLLERGRMHNPVTMTHQEIASELGSAREVVSRILEDLSDRGLLRVSRGAVEILDFSVLKEKAGL